MGMIGYGIGAYWQFSGPVTAGVISTIAYLGPRFIDTAGAGLIDWFKNRQT